MKQRAQGGDFAHGTPHDRLLQLSPDGSERRVPLQAVLDNVTQEILDGPGDISVDALETVVPDFREDLAQQIGALSEEIAKVNQGIIEMINAHEISWGLTGRMASKRKENLHPFHFDTIDRERDAPLLAEVKALCEQNPKLKNLFLHLYKLVLIRASLVRKMKAVTGQ